MEEPSLALGDRRYLLVRGAQEMGSWVADRPASNPEPVSLVAKVDSEEAEVSLKEEMEDCCLKRDGGLVDLMVPLAKEARMIGLSWWRR